jgi:hypothetical protein
MELHLFEFEDQPWFPSILRDYQTDFLGFVSEITRIYLPAEGTLSELKGTNPGTVMDIASGNGRAAIGATGSLRQRGWKLLLSDKFPYSGALPRDDAHHNVQYIFQSVDALKHVPKAEVYTMFNAFHHFTDTQKIQIAEAVAQRGGKLMVFEPLQPTLIVFLKVLFSTTLGLLLAAPFIKPFSVFRLVLTYILPVGILVTCWDGLVSVLRASSKKELEALVAKGKRVGLNISFEYLPSAMAKLTLIRIE